MAFTRISNSQINSRGATTLPNQPQISAAALKEEFDAPAKQIVAPAVNNLMDELETSTSAGNLGAVAPTGRTGSTVQSVLNSLSTDLGTAEAQSHAHPNKAVIDKFADDGTGLTYDGNPVGAVTSVNSQTGAVVLTASDVGALPNTTPIPTKTSDLTNDSGFITASSLPTKTSQLTNDSGFITSGDIPTIPTKTSDLTNDSNFVADASYVHTDNNYDATAKGIVDGATAAIAAKSTVAWNQIDTTGTKIAEITIDGVKTDVKATGGGGSADAYKTIKSGGQSFVASGADTFKINAGSNVTITPLTGDKGIQISAAGGGTSTGDMLMNDYDRSGDVKSASSSGNGIKDYVASAISGKADTSSLATVATTGAYSDLSGKPTLATVATSGSYNDLSNKPTIPTVDQTYDATSSNAQSGTAVAEVVEQIYADNGVLGAKNLLPNNATSQTINGITFTVNADGSVTANGTATAEVTLWLVGDGWNYSNCKDIPLSIEDNTEYIFGGKTADSTDAYMHLVIRNSDGTNLTYWFSHKTGKKGRTSVINRASQKWSCWIRIKKGITVTNKTFYPMLRLASDPDDTYAPYAMTNKEITEELTAINNGLDDWTSPATVSSSGTVSFSGLNDSYGYKIYYTLPSGDSAYTFSKVTKSGSGTSVTLTFTTDAPSGTVCKLRILK